MIRVQREDFDVGAELARITQADKSIGAVCSFVGLVRDMNTSPTGDATDPVRSMTLDHYPGMTEKELAKIEAEANARWPLQASLIIHRYGKLLPGDQIVLVITASPHRGAAFQSCEYLMDWLKTKAPFWKLEETPDGGDWVDARETDADAAERWREKEGHKTP